jgi:hypothetical protein
MIQALECDAIRRDSVKYYTIGMPRKGSIIKCLFACSIVLTGAIAFWLYHRFPVDGRERQQSLQLHGSNRITVLSRDHADADEHETHLIDSHWEQGDLVLAGVFELNCCPERIVFDYTLSGDSLIVLLKDKAQCLCNEFSQFSLRIRGLSKKEYRISLGYRPCR